MKLVKQISLILIIKFNIANILCSQLLANNFVWILFSTDSYKEYITSVVIVFSQQYVNLSGVILCQEVRELPTLHVYIYIVLCSCFSSFLYTVICYQVFLHNKNILQTDLYDPCMRP